MSSAEPTSDAAPAPRDIFATTRWTLVVAAGRKSSPQSAAALAELCQTYWYPLYAYVRRQGHGREEAEDLVQAFFERFLARNYLEGLAAERGRFRAFLLAALKHFLANAWDRSQRQKRGGGVPHLSLDWEVANERFELETTAALSPDRAFDYAWALALLERVVTRLRAECVAEGKAVLFEQTKGYLMLGEAATPYAEAAVRLGLEEAGVRTAVHRLRKRYRALLRDELGQTLVQPEMVEEELRALRQVLAS